MMRALQDIRGAAKRGITPQRSFHFSLALHDHNVVRSAGFACACQCCAAHRTDPTLAARCDAHVYVDFGNGRVTFLRGRRAWWASYYATFPCRAWSLLEGAFFFAQRAAECRKSDLAAFIPGAGVSAYG